MFLVVCDVIFGFKFNEMKNEVGILFLRLCFCYKDLFGKDI